MTSLKDLDDAQFAELYGSDRFTASVLASRMRYIVQRMCTGLLNNAFSLILRDWYDFAATISGPPEQNYPMSSVSNSLAMFLGTMSEAVRNTIEEYGPENLNPGDVVICNDPYRAGNHVNDVCFIRPVFHEGKLISFVNLRAHQLDMGGVVPAGFSGTKRNVYENGLVIAPTLLYRDDKPVKSAFNLIFDNARFCALLLPDIKTIYQNLLLGEQLITESVERYGVDAYLGAIRYATDVSAESMQTALAELPDGVYEAEEGIDCDGVDDSIEYRIRLKITKAADRMELDFSGTSPQARTSINAGILDTKTAVGVALKFLIDPATPFTSGAYRPVDIVLPAGTFISATPPDGAVFLYWESTGPVLLAVFRALEKALGRKAVGGDYGSLNIHNANGVLADGTPWVTTAQCGGEHGPWGATEAGDADSYSVVYQANNLDPATEAIESELPAVVLRKEYAPDSSGAGQNRGGAAVLKDTLYLTAAEHWSSPLHTKSASGVGVYGGREGALGATWVFDPDYKNVPRDKDLIGTGPDVYAGSTPVAGMLDPQTKTVDPDGEYFYFASTPVWHTKPNAVFRYLTNGGGGWGSPLQRSPERVCRDVRDEYVTIEGAYRDYGVVITGDPHGDPEGLKIDEGATARRRAELAAK
ncbi:hydantoinase B/oxoprolinase family protein [Amycolatopsis rubida]|uniref:Hydantoinase B/oxoprolinase family protein n=1 Tax=Amycolatopsis rubida TaxID=112413 RepID=A0ABX0C8K5_9PSEU|nr:MULTISPECIES: hydantoinase B/oxoprolinase family protein [Amycolatopsis]MYW96267.1 hydantoinase B/oxoprolinase family protein [Amycolatopsis rubida]NEC61258.1 hydantoinase B/oxoprolinase family protein [Amycolatopsis rubida]OAP24211.1 Acetophenone carboxylase delta subunit [Amycolatopsis sp. M39]